MDENPSSQPESPYSTPRASLHMPGEPGSSGITAPARCPYCSTQANHPLVTAVREKMGCRYSVMFLVTGVVFYLLWVAQLPRRFHCASCGKLFHARTPGGKLALGFFLLLIAVVVATAAWEATK